MRNIKSRFVGVLLRDCNTCASYGPVSMCRPITLASTQCGICQCFLRAFKQLFISQKGTDSTGTSAGYKYRYVFWRWPVNVSLAAKESNKNVLVDSMLDYGSVCVQWKVILRIIVCAHVELGLDNPKLEELMYATILFS